MSLAELRAAATGDVEVQLTLAQRALSMAFAGQAHPLVASVEAMTLARLAAAQGHIAGIGILIMSLGHISDLLDDGGDIGCADAMRGEALALTDIGVDRLPTGEGDAAIGAMVEAIADAGPGACESAAVHRRFWEGV